MPEPEIELKVISSTFVPITDDYFSNYDVDGSGTDLRIEQLESKIEQLEAKIRKLEEIIESKNTNTKLDFGFSDRKIEL